MSTPATTNGSSVAGVPEGAAPPHSIEAEQSVLGAVLLSDRVHYAFVIEEGLRAEDFYRERHRLIYESMLAVEVVGLQALLDDERVVDALGEQDRAEDGLLGLDRVRRSAHAGGGAGGPAVAVAVGGGRGAHRAGRP